MIPVQEDGREFTLHVQSHSIRYYVRGELFKSHRRKLSAGALERCKARVEVLISDEISCKMIKNIWDEGSGHEKNILRFSQYSDSNWAQNIKAKTSTIGSVVLFRESLVGGAYVSNGASPHLLPNLNTLHYLNVLKRHATINTS